MLDYLSGPYFMHAGVFAECRLIHKMMMQKIILVIYLVLDPPLESLHVLTVTALCLEFVSDVA